MQTDAYAFIFETNVLKELLKTIKKEKIIAFKAILINSLYQILRLLKLNKEYYLNLVANLSCRLHIQVLSFMVSPKEYLEFNNLEESMYIRSHLLTFLPKVIPNTSLEITTLAFNDLNNYGILNTDSESFMTVTSSSGWNLLGNRVTESEEIL